MSAIDWCPVSDHEEDDWGTEDDLETWKQFLREINATSQLNQSTHTPTETKFTPPMTIAMAVAAVAILTNIILLAAISKVRGTISANISLIISLCISDIFLSISVLMDNLNATPYICEAETCVFVVTRACKSTSHIIALLNLLGLAVDHYFAIIYPLNHKSLMSTTRAKVMILMFWLFAALCGCSDFYIPLFAWEYFTYKFCLNSNDGWYSCSSIACSRYDAEYFIFALVPILLITITVMYTRIYIQIRKFTQFRGRMHQRTVRRNRRGLCTTFLILSTFMVCWLPYCLFELSIIILLLLSNNKDSTLTFFSHARSYDRYLYDLILVNCFCDPIIYALRMREVRAGYQRLVQTFLKPCLGSRLPTGSRPPTSLSSSFSRSDRCYTCRQRGPCTKHKLCLHSSIVHREFPERSPVTDEQFSLGDMTSV